jgi:methionyl aminopeptidase
VERFARRNGYSLIRNLASHGTGRALHEEPGVIPTWREPRERRLIEDGMVFTVEPFLSTGADWAEDAGDGWTLVTDPAFRSVQYEHTLVAARRGPVILTQAH